MTRLKASLITNLLLMFKKINVIKLGSFELKDGSLSKVFIDLRILPNFPNEFQETIRTMTDQIHNDIEPFDGIIAPPLAGIPFGMALALLMNKEFYLARYQSKKHGTKKLIEGDISKKRILLVDDVFTAGESKVPLINAIRDHGGIVNTLSVVINRSSKKEKLTEFEQKHQVKVHYLLSLEDLI